MTYDARDVQSQECQRLAEGLAYEYSRMVSRRGWQETATGQANLLERRRKDAGEAY